MAKVTIFFIAITLLFMTGITNAGDTMYVHLVEGEIVKIAVSSIDSIVFYADTTEEVITVTDFDGNVYSTVTIGDQTWMAENLRTTHYADGTSIPKVIVNDDWNMLGPSEKAYCWYNNDSAANAIPYGAFYTWAAAVNGETGGIDKSGEEQGVCPTGWHLPSDAEWTELENYLAVSGYNYDGSIGGGRAKIAKALAASSGWQSSTITGSAGNTDYPEYRNKSGFTALPAGQRSSNGVFCCIVQYGCWWSATDYDEDSSWLRYIGYVNSDVVREYTYNEMGNSVRCIKD